MTSPAATETCAPVPSSILPRRRVEEPLITPIALHVS